MIAKVCACSSKSTGATITRFLANPETSVKDGDQASILAAVAGVFPLTPDRGSAMPVGEKVPWTVEGQSWNLVLGHAVGSYPKEACGILLVHGQRPHHITEVRPTRNATSGNPAKRYVIDPLEFLDVDKWAEQRGLIICGFYHSHPDHPPAPSDYDRELAWEGYLYLILSIKGGIFDEARAWIWNIDEVRFEEVIFRSPDKKGHNRNPQC